MRKTLLGGMIAAAAVLTAGAASAHHSAAMFDHNKTVTLTGTVREFRWTNPHATLMVVAPGAAGPTSQWNVECSAINILARKGWKSKSFAPGDKVSLTMHPMKDGSAAGLMLTANPAGGQPLTDHDY
jgi:hypothetical protein